MKAQIDIGDVMKQTVMTIRLIGLRKAALRLRLARPLFVLAAWVAGLDGVKIEKIKGWRSDHGTKTS